ncbi:MAG: hypothetical protein HY002_11220 [Candidatus Rokubacteria bacterium]|nr:hypothetical protein [Candidatus Rokubacteria bacterium]
MRPARSRDRPVPAAARLAADVVPCRDGRSRCPEKWAEPADLAAGARVLLELALRLDAALAAAC